MLESEEMVATKQTDRRLYRDRVRESADLVYYEIVLDAVGSGNFGPVNRMSSIGVMSKEYAERFRDLLDEMQRQTK